MSLGLASGTFDEIQAALQDLFPDAEAGEAVRLQAASEAATSIPASLVPRLLTASAKRALQSAARRSAPGPSGWRYEHLQVLLSHGDSLESLTALLQLLLDGNVPLATVSLLRRASLVPLMKASGGLRPLAVGETLRRLAARALLIQEHEKLKVAVAPHQQAIGQKAACELVVKAVRLLGKAHPDIVVATLDMTNTYNSLSRASMIEATESDPLAHPPHSPLLLLSVRILIQTRSPVG